MNASDVLAAVRAVVEAGERYVLITDANPSEWPGGASAWLAEDLTSYDPLRESIRAARPALAAIVAAFDTPLAWREEDGDVVVPHEDGSEEGFYAGETATKVVLAVNTLAAIASREVVCVSRDALAILRRCALVALDESPDGFPQWATDDDAIRAALAEAENAR